MRIQKAVISDIKPIHKILNHYADKGLLLPRSLSELYDHLRDYFVLKRDGDTGTGDPPKKALHGSGQVPGCQDINFHEGDISYDPIHEASTVYGVCGLGVCWQDIAEIKSLAVMEALKRRGFGSGLVQACLEEAKSLGLRKVFALTYVPEYFLRFGFREVEKSALPHKIWADCLKCPKFPDCDETAVIIDL